MTTRKSINDKKPNGVQDGKGADWDKHMDSQNLINIQVFNVKRDAIKSVTGARVKIVVGELDPGNGKLSVTRGVAPGEFIKIKAGDDVLELAFTHINEQGRLAFMVFNNKKYEGDQELSLDEGITRVTSSPTFASLWDVKIKRLPLLSPENGKIANVEVWAEKQ